MSAAGAGEACLAAGPASSHRGESAALSPGWPGSGADDLVGGLESAPRVGLPVRAHGVEGGPLPVDSEDEHFVPDRRAVLHRRVDVHAHARGGVHPELAGRVERAVVGWRLDGDLVERRVDVEQGRRRVGVGVVVGVGRADDAGGRRGRRDGQGASTVVAPVVTSTLRFWPSSPTIRRRSTVGLKSTPNAVPVRGTLSRERESPRHQSCSPCTRRRRCRARTARRWPVATSMPTIGCPGPGWRWCRSCGPWLVRSHRSRPGDRRCETDHLELPPRRRAARGRVAGPGKGTVSEGCGRSGERERPRWPRGSGTCALVPPWWGAIGGPPHLYARVVGFVTAHLASSWDQSAEARRVEAHVRAAPCGVPRLWRDGRTHRHGAGRAGPGR